MNSLVSATLFSKQAEEQLVSANSLVRKFRSKLLFSNTWNAISFMIVFIFYAVVGVGVISLKGDSSTLCRYEQPTVTRLIPFLVLNPYPYFCVHFCADSLAAALTLWAMLPSFQTQRSETPLPIMQKASLFLT